MNETRTWDNKQILENWGLEDVDKAFLNWWDKKLNLHYTNKDGHKIKVPVHLFTSERWYRARLEGTRDKDGVLIVPIIIISRTNTSDSTDGPTARRFADIQQYHTIAQQADIKSSQIQNLLALRPLDLDPSAPIYEIYSIPVPDHYSLTYEVSIWSPYMEDMNSFIEKIGQEFDYKSKKLFKFDMDNGLYFIAFKEDELTDDSNLNDFSRNERIIRTEYTFNVSAHIVPESDERRSPMRRYWSQTKLVIKNETALTQKEFDEIFKKGKK